MLQTTITMETAAKVLWNPNSLKFRTCESMIQCRLLLLIFNFASNSCFTRTALQGTMHGTKTANTYKIIYYLIHFKVWPWDVSSMTRPRKFISISTILWMTFLEIMTLTLTWSMTQQTLLDTSTDRTVRKEGCCLVLGALTMCKGACMLHLPARALQHMDAGML